MVPEFSDSIYAFNSGAVKSAGLRCSVGSNVVGRYNSTVAVKSYNIGAVIGQVQVAIQLLERKSNGVKVNCGVGCDIACKTYITRTY